MKIVKIKNRYMFNSNNPPGTHDYLVYKDSKTNEVRAIPLTHLYYPDKRRFFQMHQGYLKKMYFNHRDTPTGVNNYYLTNNVYGSSIDLNHPDVNKNVYRKIRISKKQEEDVLRFASKHRK